METELHKQILLQLEKVKKASHGLLGFSNQVRSDVLKTLSDYLTEACPDIIEANQKDLALMHSNDPRYDRLLLNKERIQAIAKDVKKVASLPTNLGTILSERNLSNGLKISQVTTPLGVIAVIYESRPNVTVDVFSLCFKTGNACILKGGKEAFHSNQILVSLVQKALSTHKINPHIIYLLPAEREATASLLNAIGKIDVCIPRGSQNLIQYVRDNAKIPVIETGAGIVHTYFDKEGNLEKGIQVINNAKTRRVSVCNALDTLVIHQSRLEDLPALVSQLATSRVTLHADEASFEALKNTYPNELLTHAEPEDFGHEYLSYDLSIKTTPTISDAIEHIRQHTSGHSEAIITENRENANQFFQEVDAAVVYLNASTAFTDGGQFGMGAEIGISTQKLHARGPMALDALTTYKWQILGDGQIRE